MLMVLKVLLMVPFPHLIKLAEMCGNGVRSFTKYVFDYNREQNLIPRDDVKIITVETLAGILTSKVIDTTTSGPLSRRKK